MKLRALGWRLTQLVEHLPAQEEVLDNLVNLYEKIIV
jgi:hypothetical protein